ncbi:MAG TPA: hypothetical protein VFZ09_12345 [Archangium sp.]|uniref:hypothetical protein n=1 Tax=Archangium sp. TaxID=1872627 RepID=UPI002E36F4E6|nr:hypothetical protein [Archangium sp.]HEX5747027.1 hypothetical protein [Archangium sp.]
MTTSAASPVVTGAIPINLEGAVRAKTAPPLPRTASEVPVIPDVAGSPETAGRADAGEQWISRLLRGGALCSGALFLASLGLEFLPRSETVHVGIDVLRKGAASALLVTPVVRLVVAGTSLGLRGEWKYALYAAGVLGLLAVAVGAGLHA